MRTIEEVLSNYTKTDAPIVKDTIDELCKHGIGSGCYQNYAVLTDVIEVLSYLQYRVEQLED